MVIPFVIRNEFPLRNAAPEQQPDFGLRGTANSFPGAWKVERDKRLSSPGLHGVVQNNHGLLADLQQAVMSPIKIDNEVHYTGE